MINFNEKFADLLPGRRVTYHRGLLMEDRFTNKAVNKTAKEALAAAERGWAILIQVRHGPRDYEYVAIRIRKLS